MNHTTRSASVIEVLEARIAPATHIWKAGVILGNWSNPNNWSAGGVPTSNEPGGTIVQFDGTTSTTDDIPNLVVDHIRFTATGNTIKGAPGIALGINGAVQNTNIVNDVGTNEIDVSLPLVLSGNTTYTLITAGKLTIKSQISGNQGLLLPSASAGTLELASTTANTFTGDLTVNAGTLLLHSSATAGSIPKNLNVGDGSGSANSALVTWLGDDQVADTTQVTVKADGKLNLNNFSDQINVLALYSGTTAGATVTTGTGTLTLGGDILLFNSGNGAVGCLIDGILDLGDTSRTISVANGAANVDLTIAAQIKGNNFVGYTKSGAGTLELQNTGPSGLVQVSDGTLLLNSDNRAGAISQGLVVGSDSGVNATVKLLQADQISGPSGVEVKSDGVLNLNSFDDTIASLTVTSGTATGSSVTTGAGTLTLSGLAYHSISGTGATAATISGNIDFGGFTFTVGDGAAASDVVINAKIVGTDGYTKFGAGTLEVKNTGPVAPVIVLGGTLLLNSPNLNDAIRGPLSIGQAGLTNSGTVKLAQGGEIADGVTVTVYSTSIFDMNGSSDQFANLIVAGGYQSAAQVTTGGGTLFLSGDVTSLNQYVGAPAAVISGTLSLGPGTHAFNIASGGADTDLRITAPILGAGAAINKLGGGTLEFANTADNTYTGNTVISDGTLFLNATTSGDATSDNIVIGDGSGGVQSAILRLGQSNVIPNTANITVFADGFLDLAASSDTVGAVAIQSKGSIDLGSGTLQTGNFGLSSDSFYAGGTAGKISATGTVNVGGKFAQRFEMPIGVGSTATIITNDNADAVTGTFAGLAEGAVFGTKAGLFKISYVGGDGNDVTITQVDASAILTIAPGGKSASFTDVDGDLVTVKTTKGTFTPANFAFGSLGSGILNGYQFQGLYPSADFTGAQISVTAKTTALGGNGRVNLGALLYNGFDLASFTLPGDLAYAQGGDNDPKVPAIGKIVVDSVGTFGNATSGLFPGMVGLSFKQAPSIKIKGDVRGANFDLGPTGSLVIGGSLIGNANGVGSINSTASIKSILIGGSIIAVPGSTSGAITVDGDLGSITVGHDLIGAVKIQSGGKLGAVTVKGAVAGESLAKPAIISGVGSATAPVQGADVAIGSVTIGQSAEFLQILGGYDKTRTAKNADAVISKVKVAGDFRASSIFAGVVAGVDNLLGTGDDTKAAVTRDAANRFSGIASIMIKGQAIGTVNTGDVFAIESETIGKAVINGFTYKTKLGARNAQDTFGLGFASAGPGGTLSDFYLREITA